MFCPFCEIEVSEFHQNSHVVPDWLYKLSFKENKNLKSYGLDIQEEEIALKQSSLKGPFICRDCETVFGDPEGYARLVFGDETNHSSIPNVANADVRKVNTQFGLHEGYEMIGLDFKKLKKFVLGVILKGHMAKTGLTKDLLGDKHFIRMREIYLEDHEGDDLIYPIFVFKFNENQPFWNMVSQPVRTKSKEGLNLISFKGGGYEFNVNVQSHPLTREEAEFRFRKEGRLLMLKAVQNLVAIREFLEKAKKLKADRWGS